MDDARSEQTHIVVVFTDAGGGHRAAAEALRDILTGDGRHRVTLVNAYQEVLPHLDLFARFTSRTVEGTYNDLILRGGRTGLFCLGFYALAVLNVALLARAGRRAFAALWEREKPDLVISVLPVINALLADSLAAHGDGRTPMAILITDWAEMSRNVWFPPHTTYHAICGTEDSHRQIVRKGHPANRVHRTDGLLIRPAFLDRRPTDLAAERRALGLDPDRPVACMLYGGHGSWRMLELARALADTPAGERPDLQVLFLCGRNEELAEALRAADLPFGHRVVGYTTEVHRHMAVSDLFIGKTGPASVSEALSFGLPLLMDRQHAMPQERVVRRWIARTRTGESFSTAREFVDALHRLTRRDAPGRQPTPGIGANRAAHQIPGIVRAILGTGAVERDRERDGRQDGQRQAVDA